MRSRALEQKAMRTLRKEDAALGLDGSGDGLPGLELLVSEGAGNARHARSLKRYGTVAVIRGL